VSGIRHARAPSATVGQHADDIGAAAEGGIGRMLEHEYQAG
jgi:hypothetical protein